MSMDCTRFQTDGMRFLDGEMTDVEKADYESHIRQCQACASELRELGRIVGFTDELRLRPPDPEFWRSYWAGIYRRTERRTGFLFVMIGLIAVVAFAVYKAVTSPEFLTFKGLGITAILVGLIIVFLSVVRERYHEHKNDPYKGVEQ